MPNCSVLWCNNRTVIQTKTHSKVTRPDLSKNRQKLLNVNEEDIDKYLSAHSVSLQAVEAMVENIKNWYQKQNHLPQGHLHAEVIARLLAVGHFSVEVTKQRIDNYFTARHKMPELLMEDPKSPMLDKYLKRAYWIVLPKLTPENYRVTIFRMDRPDDVIMTEIFRTILLISEYRLFNEVAEGDCFIFDYCNLTLQNIVQFTPLLLSKLAFYFRYCIPVKIKAVYVVHMPTSAETIFNWIKKLLNKKLLERIHFCNSIEEATRMFPRSIIPKDLGGEEMSCQEIAERWQKTLQSPQWREYFIEQSNVRTDESKRGIPTRANDLLGIDGSFRKLDID